MKVANVAALSVGENLEATARRIRYEFFAEVAVDYRAQWIATGHTADDQAETVLHRIIRGTGIQGLRGIIADRSQESGVRSQESGVRSQESGVRSQETCQSACSLTPVPVS